MNKLFIAILWLLGLLLLGAGCENEPPPVAVDLSQHSRQTVQPGQLHSPGQVIRLGIGSMITPKEGYIYYRRLADYLEKKLETPVMIVDRGTYQEFNELLADGGLDLAFVCGGPYVLGRDAFQLELLVAPETLAGEIVYYSYLIVPKESPARTLEDLRGQKFAFTDPHSNTGWMVPSYLLARLGETAEGFFGEVVYTYAHDKSVQAVAGQRVAGAAVDSLIYDYLAAANPEMVAKTKILAVSEPYGIPPVVVRPDLPAAQVARLRDVLLAMHENPEGASILKGMLLGRFVVADDAAYDSIREIERFIRKSAEP